MCEAIYLLFWYILEAAAVSGDPGDRVKRENASRGSNNSRGANPDRRTRSRQSTRNPPAACVLCWTNCSSSLFEAAFLVESKKNTSEQQAMRSQHTSCHVECVQKTATAQQSCSIHNTSIRGRDSWGSRASHGRMYLILRGASPRRVPLESAEVRLCPRLQFYP